MLMSNLATLVALHAQVAEAVRISVMLTLAIYYTCIIYGAHAWQLNNSHVTTVCGVLTMFLH